VENRTNWYPLPFVVGAVWQPAIAHENEATIPIREIAEIRIVLLQGLNPIERLFAGADLRCLPLVAGAYPFPRVRK
jgi:hypothetical protein